jgi:hypothetical protein
VTILGDTQAIARVTDAGPDTITAAAVGRAPMQPLLAQVTMLPLPPTTAFPVVAAMPATLATQELSLPGAPIADESDDDVVPAEAEPAEDELDEDELDEDELDEDELDEADLHADDLSDDEHEDDDATGEGDVETPGPEAALPSHDLIYQEAMASIAALAQNWSHAVEGLVVPGSHQAAA